MLDPKGNGIVPCQSKIGHILHSKSEDFKVKMKQGTKNQNCESGTWLLAQFGTICVLFIMTIVRYKC